MEPRSRRVTLAAPLDAGGESLPTEIRLFAWGENPTRKGTFIFDDKSAELVMAEFTEHGVDLMFDLEHLSIDPEGVSGDGRNFNPDAMAWSGLEVRQGDGCYAVGIKFTPSGEKRVREKSQRYVSPAFNVDDEDRVIEIINVAITALPATDGTPALVAATSRKPGRNAAGAIKASEIVSLFLRAARPSQRKANAS